MKNKTSDCCFSPTRANSFDTQKDVDPDMMEKEAQLKEWARLVIQIDEYEKFVTNYYQGVMPDWMKQIKTEYEMDTQDDILFASEYDVNRDQLPELAVVPHNESMSTQVFSVTNGSIDDAEPEADLSMLTISGQKKEKKKSKYEKVKERKPYKKNRDKGDSGHQNVRITDLKRDFLIDVLEIVGTVDKPVDFQKKVPYILEIAGSIGYPINERGQKNVISIIFKKIQRLFTPRIINGVKQPVYMEKSILQEVDKKFKNPEARNQKLRKLLDKYQEDNKIDPEEIKMWQKCDQMRISAYL